jgi:NAD(P)-dependent dehydrogenase (short-subunit alcohol dehydrogenase family)
MDYPISWMPGRPFSNQAVMGSTSARMDIGTAGRISRFPITATNSALEGKNMNANAASAPQESNDWLGLAGRVCVVTGAGSGVGAGAARALAAQGASVAVLDRNGPAAAAIAIDIERMGGRAVGIVADVTNEDAVAKAAEQILRELGACHVLVNNAALVLGSTGSLMDADLAQWNQMLAVNLTGSLICTRAFGRHMIAAAHGGSIINVSSICGHIPRPDGGAYSPSKAALMMMSRMLAVELAAHRIRCNSVSPAWVRTPASEATYSDPVLGEQRRRMVPAGRISGVEDLGNVIAFMASDRASYINGQDILVDGGLSQTLMNLVPKSVKPVPSVTE